jgi:hypothetical protein
MLAGRYALLLSWKRKYNQAEPSAGTTAAFHRKILNPGNRSQTRQPFDNSSCSDEIFHALPQSIILSSSLHEAQIITHSSTKS